MALSGDEIILNRKHTTRLDVAVELTNAFDRYQAESSRCNGPLRT
jgi:hypothetical protein